MFLRLSSVALATSLTLIVTAIPAEAQVWDQIDLGTTKTIYALGAASGWAAGDSGFVARSTDLIQWTTVDVQTTQPLHSVIELSNNQYWVAGDSGTVRVGSSAGWANRDVPSTGSVRLYSRNSGCAYAVDGIGGLFTTCNFGQGWTAVDYGSTVPLNNGAGFVTSRSWAVGDSGLVLRTDNGGVDWVTQPTGTTANLNYIAEAGGNALVAVGEGGTILHTANLGENWNVIPIAATADLHSIDVSGLNGNWLLVVGDNGTILRTTDAGASWCQITGVTDADLYAVRMVTNTDFIVAGEGGAAFRTTNGGGECVFVSVETEVPATELAVDGPYPQPGTDVSSFNVQTTRPDRLTVSVYDVLGREVQVLNQSGAIGGSGIRIDVAVAGLPSGSYFVRFDDGERRAMRSIVVQR
jgi:photosystem II stability/assembly factor-like uncharacterized protein